MVSRPVDHGGLGFTHKWNMGWMHDTLGYFQHDPVHRRFHHRELTFGLLYAFTENFVLPLSHDEVVHGKGSLLGKMPGDEWQRFANLRALYGWMWAYPGGQLLFMGGEIAQWTRVERGARRRLGGRSTARAHRGVQELVRALNRVSTADRGRRCGSATTSRPASSGSTPTTPTTACSPSCGGRPTVARCVACLANFTPVPRDGYRVGLPWGGEWRGAARHQRARTSAARATAARAACGPPTASPTRASRPRRSSRCRRSACVWLGRRPRP